MARDDTAAADTRPAPGFARALLPLTVLALLIAVGFTAMGSFGLVQESAKTEMHLSDTALGMIQGL